MPNPHGRQTDLVGFDIFLDVYLDPAGERGS
jgi:hypothetical protein